MVYRRKILLNAFKKKVWLFPIVVSSLIFVACGGGANTSSNTTPPTSNSSESSNTGETSTTPETPTPVPVVTISADFSYTASHLTVILDGGLSSSSDDSDLSYVWDFGDGETSTEIRPRHVYAKEGDYTVKLTVSREGSTSQQKSILLRMPSVKTGFEAGGQVNLSRSGVLVENDIPVDACMIPNVNHANSVSTINNQDEGLTPSDYTGQYSLKTYWTEAGYDYVNHPRIYRSAQICVRNYGSAKEAWAGFMVYVPSSFPHDKQSSIFNSMSTIGGCISWTSLLNIVNNDLVIQHRTGCGGSTDRVVATDIPRDRWIPIVVHYVVSHKQQGLIQIWVDKKSQDEQPSYSAENIDFGFGEWNDNDTLKEKMSFTLGQYAFDEANYTANETRTLYFDNIGMIDGTQENAWNVVNPMNTGFNYTGAVTSSNNQRNGTGAQAAFDGDSTTKFTNDNGRKLGEATWLQYRYPKGENYKAISYKITSTSSSDTRAFPQNWTLFGSNNGSDWTNIATESNQSFSRNQTKTYSVAAPDTYQYYRFLINANGGIYFNEIGEIEFTQ